MASLNPTKPNLCEMTKLPGNAPSCPRLGQDTDYKVHKEIETENILINIYIPLEFFQQIKLTNWWANNLSYSS